MSRTLRTVASRGLAAVNVRGCSSQNDNISLKEERSMRVGIIGAGGIGLAVATQLAKAGVATLISNDRGAASLANAARDLGPSVSAASRFDAAHCDIVVLAVPWASLDVALAGLPAWNGRILIDAMNPIVPPGFTVADLGGRTSSELVAAHASDARVVKAFNTLPPPVLQSDPRHAGGRRVIVMSGDDAEAKRTVGALVTRLGFATIDLGSLVEGGRLQQFPGGPFPTLNLIQLP
jgi:predicted dinucleotide-binding enzyme